MEITTAMVKELREATGAGVLDCRKALEDSGGDVPQAVEMLREKGLAAAARREDRETREGRIEAYVHPGNRIAVLLEMNCETDFVAKTEEFKSLAHDLALHIAFAAPRYVARTDVLAAEVEEQQAAFRAQAIEEGKPEHILDRIIQGRMEKFYQQVCLMEQPFVRDEDRTVQDLLNDTLVKLGEKIKLRRFVRYQLGEDLD